MLAQGRARVVVPVDSALLEFRDQEIHQVFIIVGRVKRWRDLKPVAAAFFEKVLHGVLLFRLRRVCMRSETINGW